jgi:hypothetical protein
MPNTRLGMVWANPGELPKTRQQYFSFSSGFLAAYKNMYLGFSAFNINRPDVALVGSYKLPVRYSVNASFNKSLGDNSSINFTGVYQMQQTWQTVWFYSTYYYKKVFASLGISNGQYMGGLGVRYKRISAGYNYDVYVSKLAGNSIGSHQVSLSLNFKSKKEPLQGVAPETW